MSSYSTTKPVIFLAFANDKQNYLYNLTTEQRSIRSELEIAEKAGLCEVVYETDATIESIFDVFQRYLDRIAVFHYGGHADDYKMLLETSSGDSTTIHSAGLSKFLARQHGLQLVFINGCCSQNQAQELINAGVPAVIGTSQPIEDSIATDLSTRFYSGLANGESIDRSWSAAVEMIKSVKGESTYRSLIFDKVSETLTAFPWNMYYRNGADTVKDWNLPSASKSPLFGLPDIQDSYYRKLPENPFIGLNYFKKEYAGIFYGRGEQIRELYNRITGIHSIILFYGNSGTGKSSLLDAGLIPRIEHEYEVQYIRRDQTKGLTQSLVDGLEQLSKSTGTNDSLKMSESERMEKISELTKAMDTASETVRKVLESEIKKLVPEFDGQSPLSQTWCNIEEATSKPLLIVLDQVEECFTRVRPSGPEAELSELLRNIQSVFDNEGKMPKGKLILAYRKEFHPEIRDGFKKRMLPFSEVYLKHMNREGIIEAVEGITKQEYTRNNYKLAIAPSKHGTLSHIIADDLLEDKESPVAPMLQIILTKLWNSAIKENPNMPTFTVENYQKIKKAGVAMNEFFEQQMAQLYAWKPELVNSGLVLDILYSHTTHQGTSGTQSLQLIRENYQHNQEIIDNLIQKCKDLYLLTELHGDGNTTSLAHDTLAPVVIYRFNESDTPGQRATRILNNKLRDFDKEEKGVYLEEADLLIVEQGLKGMKQLREKANKLLKISQQLQVQREKQRKRNRLLMKVLAGALVLFAVFAGFQWISAQQSADKAQLAAIAAEKEKDKALKAEQVAIAAEKETINQLIQYSWKAGAFLKTIGEPNFEKSGSWIKGLRSIYTFLRPVMDLQKMQSLSPVPIFLSGPHSDGEQHDINLRSYNFGHYNPEFFVWGQEHLIPAAKDENFRKFTQNVYNDYILDLARVYYDTYLYMKHRVNPQEIQRVKEDYTAEIERLKGTPYTWEFSSGPGERIYMLFDYSYVHSQANFQDKEMVEYNEFVSPGFWIRRDIDGSQEEALKLLEMLLETYDARFVKEMKRFYAQ